MNTGVDAFLDNANDSDVTVSIAKQIKEMTDASGEKKLTTGASREDKPTTGALREDKLTTGASRKDKPLVDDTKFVCNSYNNLGLQCVDVNGRPAWQGVTTAFSATAGPSVHNFMNATCPPQSRSWRTQLLCDLKPGETSKCYKFVSKSDDNSKLGYNAVCVTSKHGKELKLSPEGLSLLLEPSYATQGDTAISSDSHVFNTLQPCYMQTFVGLSTNNNDNVHTTALTLYTQRGDTKACKASYTKAMSACEKANQDTTSAKTNCASKIKRILPNKTSDDTYRCVLKPSRIQSMHGEKNPEWYHWVRGNEPEGRASTLYRSHMTHEGSEKNSTLNGGSYKTTGIPNIQREVCSLTLNTNGSHSGEHNRVRQKPTYYIPTPCDLRSDNATSYCGKIGGYYTGHCASYTQDGKLSHGCKPFDNESEIKKFRSQDRERAEALIGDVPLRNTSLHHPKLRVCTAGDLMKINTQILCKHTTTALLTERDSVVAKNQASAVEQCNSTVFQSKCTKDNPGCTSYVFYNAVASDHVT